MGDLVQGLPLQGCDSEMPPREGSWGLRTGSLGKRSPPLAQGQVLVGLRGKGWASSCHPKGLPPCPLTRPFAEPAAAEIHMLATGNKWKKHCLLPAHSRQSA